jgi:putative NADH-flavin reductase
LNPTCNPVIFYTMKITLYGASGMIGSRILTELLLREHHVTAVVRDPAKITQPGVVVKTGDVLDADRVAETARGSEAAISAYAPPPDATAKLSEATHALIAGLKHAHVRRLLVVGGAGSLDAKPGTPLVDTPHFPPQFKPYAVAHREALAILKQADLDWTCLTPAATIEPGKRTGIYRTGGDILVTDQHGHSRISAEDYAVALVDELEKPHHIRQRFTLAY